MLAKPGYSSTWGPRAVFIWSLLERMLYDDIGGVLGDRKYANGFHTLWVMKTSRLSLRYQEGGGSVHRRERERGHASFWPEICVSQGCPCFLVKWEAQAAKAPDRISFVLSMDIKICAEKHLWLLVPKCQRWWSWHNEITGEFHCSLRPYALSQWNEYDFYNHWKRQRWSNFHFETRQRRNIP